MNYTVMIIDDEKTVREGICQLIDWQAEGFGLASCGKDGREGLANILRERPDLVLVDIKMPGLSGLEVIREAKKEGFEGHFLILTGYSEFEYARSAITMGVEGYLLKPIDEDELLAYVRAVRGKLEEAARWEHFHSRNEDKARQELLRRIVLGKEGAAGLRQEAQALSLDLDGTCFCAAVCRGGAQSPKGAEDAARFGEKLGSLTEGVVGCVGQFELENQAVLVFRGLEYGDLKESLAKRNRRVESYFGDGFKIAVGNNVRDWQELVCSYESAVYLLDAAFLFDGEAVLTIDLICGLTERREGLSVEYLEFLIEVGEAEGIRRAMDLFRDYCTWHMMRESEIKMLIIRDLVQLQMRLGKKYASEALSNEAFKPHIERLIGAADLKELLACYGQILAGLGHELGTDGNANIIRRVHYYMEKNFDKDLKLEHIARTFNYNSAYLGKLFRRETGESFNNALDVIRIANARRMLEETDLKVYQISERVSYSSIDYFYMKFKKHVGVSPKEYRNGVRPEAEA